MRRTQAIALVLILGGLGYAFWTLYSLPPLQLSKEQANHAPSQTKSLAPVKETADVTLSATSALPAHTDFAEEPDLPPISRLPEINDEEIYFPPISRSATTPAYHGDLSDHQAYLEHQSAQITQMKQDYIAAVDKKVARLESLLEKGMRHKLPAEQLQEARDKIQGLREMQAQLRRELAQ
ncbi:hypothetical protein PRUB_a3599 [Pseudoalteromonas rubra]|uniref:Uncharacterized protein n=1 Tax=Pseudoalteromonas rubra TaxID=43658 RepID=A0A8T0C3F3_9GAMM|nr:hypothetical protein [Pseudoalteromonas rubra]KAF7783752.1 hypothetical protein PRUB_a3599 [Pseudoalteromonas rubra]